MSGGGDMYRVVVEGQGERTGHVASSPMTREQVDAGYPNVRDAFAADIAAGNATVGIYGEAAYEAHFGQPDGGETDG